MRSAAMRPGRELRPAGYRRLTIVLVLLAILLLSMLLPLPAAGQAPASAVAGPAAGPVAAPVTGLSQEDATVLAAQQVFEEITRIPVRSIPQVLLADAHGIAIIPNMIKGGFVVG